MILAIDQGTTGTTCLVFDDEGRVAGRAYSRVRAALPAARLGRARRGRDLGGDAAGRRRGDRRRGHRGGRAGRRSGSPTSARRSSPGTRRRGEPLHRALVWQDRRTAARCDELREAGPRGAGARADRPGHRPLLLRRPRSSGCCATSRGRAGGLRHDRLLAALQADRPPRDRLLQRLADDAVRHPPARLGRGALRDARRRPRARCRSRCPPRTSTARRRCSAARCRWPGSPATSRRRCSARPATTPATAKNTYGTGSFVLLNTGAEAPRPGEGLLTTVAWGLARRPPTRWRPRSSSPAPPCSGCATAWGSSSEAAETEALAASLDSNDGVYFVPALTGLGSPHWDPYARGTIVGLTRGSGRAHLARAALEAIAYQTRRRGARRGGGVGERLAS